ncbi:MAG: CHAT domain-containing protein [Cyanobacteria bacterium P01_A01_bin.84]
MNKFTNIWINNINKVTTFFCKRKSNSVQTSPKVFENRSLLVTLLFISLGIISPACARVESKSLQKKVLKSNTFQSQVKNPVNYKDSNHKSNSYKPKINWLNETANTFIKQRKFKNALQVLNSALKLAIKSEEITDEAVILNNIGRVYQQQGLYSQALKSYLQALIINKERTISKDNTYTNELDSPVEARLAFGKTYSNLGSLFQSQNQPELAVFFYKHCANNREKVRLKPLKNSFQRPDAYNHTVTRTYRLLGELLVKHKRITEAQRIADLIKVQELEQYLKGVKGNNNTAKGIPLTPLSKPIKEKLDNTLDEGIVLGQELRQLRQIPPEQRNTDQKQRISQIVAVQQKLLQNFNDFIQSPEVQKQIEKINRTAKRQNLDLESLNQIRDNLANLPQKSALIYPLVLEDSLEVILVSPDSPPIRRTTPIKRKQLYEQIAIFRQALENPSREIKRPARKLYEWLIKPIEKDLKQANIKNLVYAPDDQLRYVPLAALHDGKQWLVQQFSSNYITAASLTDFNTPPSSQLRVLAAAFTKGNYKFKVGKRELAFSGLPFAAREVEKLANAIPNTKKILDNAFNPQDMVPQMDDYTIVHLATHAAFMVGKPEDSFILFGNGDKANLRDVGTWSLPKVDLIVLSACETGVGGLLGSGEEILGFGYQVQKTGAKSAIASLWSVDDGGTQTLMNEFYSLLSSGKMTKTLALKEAQKFLITGKSFQPSEPENQTTNQPVNFSGNFTHPHYWAPFILIGNGM